MYVVKILEIKILTPDTKSYIMEKPTGYDFYPGQAVSVAVDHDEWRDQMRPFTFTSLPDDEYLELIVKSYMDHPGVTAQMNLLQIGDALLISDSWGAVSYQGSGLFIAGGSGITPFLAIFRDLKRRGELADNLLVYANKSKKDIILENEIMSIFSPPARSPILYLSQESREGYLSGRVGASVLALWGPNPPKNLYLCGPPSMTAFLNQAFTEAKIEVKMIVF